MIAVLLSASTAATEVDTASPYAGSDSYDTRDLSSSAGATDCGTASIVEDATKKWENRVQLAIRFPDWRDGTRVSADFGGGITSLETCWNVEASSDRLTTGGNGEPIVTFTLGAAPHDLTVGCSFLGFWNGGTLARTRRSQPASAACTHPSSFMLHRPSQSALAHAHDGSTSAFRRPRLADRREDHLRWQLVHAAAAARLSRPSLLGAV